MEGIPRVDYALVVAGIIYMRAADLIEAEIGSDLVALEPKSGYCFGFNSVAASVWSQLSTPKSFDQLRDALLDNYDVDIDRCSSELRLLLEEMANQGLVRKQP